MDQLAPQHIPVYETASKRQRLWEDCGEKNQPVVAIRAATRGYIVRYDLQHLGVELTPGGLSTLREQTRAHRSYPTSTAHSYPTGTDPISESEGVGGEAGPISGALHAESERAAREIASRLSGIVFDQSNWRSSNH